MYNKVDMFKNPSTENIGIESVISVYRCNVFSITDMPKSPIYIEISDMLVWTVFLLFKKPKSHYTDNIDI